MCPDVQRMIGRGGLAVIMMTVGSQLLAVTGCVKPADDQPWSTKSASLSEPTATTSAPVADPVLLVATDDASAPSPTPARQLKEPLAEAEPTKPVAPAAATPVVLRGSTPVERAQRVVELAVASGNALERAYAYEAMQVDPRLLLEHGARGVVDDNRGVRFIATMAIGRAMLGELASVVHAGLLDDSESVRAATIYALRSLGEGVDPSPLASMVLSEDPEVRGNAMMVLGMLGNPSAIPLIESSLGEGMRLQNPMRVRITELQAAEALVALGKEEDVEPIRAALFAPVEQGELTVLACDMLGRLGDQQARPMLMRLLLAEGNQRRPPEIRVAAAGALFRLPAPWEPGIEKVLLDQVGAEDPRLRVQVAAALRRVPGEEADRALDRMLADPEPLVRVASAGAILGRAEGLGEATVVVPD
jgi:HEAT repeat protein